MFDLAVNALAAFQQAGTLLGGFFCLALGCLLIGSRLRWRMKAARVEGDILGVREKNGCYFPVYRYTLPTGETMEATSDSGDGLLRGKETGRRVPLLVFSEAPEDAEPAGGFLYEAVGLVLAIPGVIFTRLALTSWPVTWLTFAMLGGFALYGVLSFRKYIIPKEQRAPSAAVWKEQRRAARRAERAALPVRRIEDIMAAPENAARIALQKRSARYAAPALFIFALVCLGAGVYTGNRELTLARQGLSAPGSVVALDSERHSGHDSERVYYPVVTFKTPAGRPVRFRDRTGSNPPPHRAGDDVTVLYLKDDPEGSATIDEGMWNWLVPLLLCGAGLALLPCAVKARRREEAV